MKPQRSPCAPLAALLFAVLVCLPSPAAAQGFASGMNSGWSGQNWGRGGDSDWGRGGESDWRHPQFDRRRIEELRRELDRLMHREREDRRDHRDGFAGGMDFSRHQRDWRDQSHLEGDPPKMHGMDKTPLAKHEPEPGSRSASKAPVAAKNEPAKHQSEPAVLAGNHSASKPPVAAPGQEHQLAKMGNGNQGGNNFGNLNQGGKMDHKDHRDGMGQEFDHRHHHDMGMHQFAGFNQQGFGNQGQGNKFGNNGVGSNGAGKNGPGNNSFSKNGGGNNGVGSRLGTGNANQGRGQGQQMCARSGQGNRSPGNLVGNHSSGGGASHHKK